MSQHEEDQGIRRRRLLRRAGTVAAAVAGAGAAAAIATPAQAADGDSLVIGSNNAGTATTGLTAGSATNPALRLNNTSGAPVALGPLVTTTPVVGDPSTWTTQAPSAQAPVGSLYADDWGDFYGVGQPGGVGTKYTNLLYSPTWATMVVPISPIRFMDTRVERSFIVPGSANFDSSFRVLPKNSTTVPDLVLDLSPLFGGGFGAVQANLTALLPVAQGFASLWDAGDWPGTSSVNYTPSVAEIANFTQTVIGPDLTIRLKTNRAAQFIIDIVGFVVRDPFTQLGGAPAAAAAAGLSAQASAKVAQWRKNFPSAR